MARKFRRFKRELTQWLSDSWEYVSYDIPRFWGRQFKGLSRYLKWLKKDWDNRPRLTDSWRKQLRSLTLGAREAREGFEDGLGENFRTLVKLNPLMFLLNLPRILLRLGFAAIGEVFTLIGRFFSFWWRFIRRRHPIIQGGVAVMAVAGIFVVIFARTIKNEIDAIWAERLIEESQELTEEEKFVEAYEAGEKAWKFTPLDPDAIENLMEITDRVGHPQSVLLGEKLVSRREGDVDSLLRLVDLSLKYDRADVTKPYMAFLRRKMPDDERVALADVRLLLQEGKRQEAFVIARREVQEGTEAPLLHSVYVSLALRSGVDSLLEEARAHIRELSERADQLGLEFLRLRIQQAQALGEEPETLIGKLLEHPDVTAADRQAIATYQMQTEQISKEEALQTIRGLYDPEEAEEKRRLATWMVANGFPEQVLELISEEDAKADAEAAKIWLDARMLVDDPEELDAYLDEIGRKELPISAAEFRLYRALIARQQNRIEDFRYLGLLAVQASNPSKWGFLERRLSEVGDVELMIEFYRHIAKSERMAVYGKSRLVSMLYFLGRDDELVQLLPQLSPKEFADRPEIAAFVGYLKVLHGSEVVKVRRELETLLAQRTENRLIRDALALAYYESGQPQLARSLAEYGAEGEALPSFLKLSRAIVWANTEQNKATQVDYRQLGAELYLQVEKQRVDRLQASS